jgi:hypothetical protein
VSGALFSWDLTNSKQIHSFQGHNSAVTGFEVRKKKEKKKKKKVMTTIR